MKRLRITFDYEGLDVRASAKNINQYHEAEDFRLSVYDSDGEFVYPDYITMCDIEESALEMMFEMHFSPQVMG